MSDFDPNISLQENLDAWTTKISKAVHLLHMWNVLHYTGHFTDAHPEMKERIDSVNEKTELILQSFGYDIHYTAENPAKMATRT